MGSTLGGAVAIIPCKACNATQLVLTLRAPADVSMLGGTGDVSMEAEDHSSPMSHQLQEEIFQQKCQKQMPSEPLGEGGGDCA